MPTSQINSPTIAPAEEAKTSPAHHPAPPPPSFSGCALPALALTLIAAACSPDGSAPPTGDLPAQPPLDPIVARGQALLSQIQADPLTRVMYYPVEGGSLQEVVHSMAKRAPFQQNNSSGRQDHEAHTGTYLVYNYQPITSNGVVYAQPSSNAPIVECQSHATLNLPLLTTTNALTSAEKQEWSRESAAIVLHEDEHRTIGRDHAQKFIELNTAFFGAYGSLPQSIIESNFISVANSLREAHKRLDIETDHGTKEGTLLNTNLAHSASSAEGNPLRHPNPILDPFYELLNRPGVSLSFYPIAGSSLQELKALTTERGPFQTWARTTQHGRLPTVAYSHRSFLTWSDSTKPTFLGPDKRGVEVTVSLNVVVPYVTSPDRLSNQEREQLQNFYLALRVLFDNLYENGIDVARQMQGEVQQRLPTLSTSDLEEIGTRYRTELKRRNVETAVRSPEFPW